MNFGETIAYWYLRLNGFFPLSNFVLHRSENVLKHSADADLLAIRFPNVYEEIGGQKSDWDSDRFREWNLDLGRVKTGRNRRDYIEGIKRAFNSERLLYGICRFGIWKRNVARNIREHLLDAPFYRDPKGLGVVGKLLIAADMPEPDQIPPCLQLQLQDADEFILHRMNKYMGTKLADRMYFPSELIQYIIWRQNRSGST